MKFCQKLYTGWLKIENLLKKFFNLKEANTNYHYPRTHILLSYPSPMFLSNEHSPEIQNKTKFCFHSWLIKKRDFVFLLFFHFLHVFYLFLTITKEYFLQLIIIFVYFLWRHMNLVFIAALESRWIFFNDLFRMRY